MSEQAIVNIVMDKYGSQVSGVEIEVKNRGIKTLTDINGEFNLDLKIGDVLFFKHELYLNTELKVTNSELSKGIRIHLQDRLIKSPSTVPGPFGENTDSDNYIGSSSTVYTDQLTKTIGTTVIPALVGRVSGLNITQNRGARLHHVTAISNSAIGGNVPLFGRRDYSDNTEFSINSRGQSPVVIIDGIRRDFFGIDPEAIESISLQKDALSSMFLGMESSRGALIITTRKPDRSSLMCLLQESLELTAPLKCLKH